MILLHVVVVALYGLTAIASWPVAAAPGASIGPGGRVPAGAAAWLLPVALFLHAWLGWQDIVTPEGLDLSLCTAYSDSVNDVPMLSAVGNAVAINPDTGLRAAARENGWEVRDFRTGRRAAKVGVPATAGTGMLVGGVMAGLALRRRKVARRRPLARATRFLR